ncbi:hypothetical protein MESS4_120032 [Mesorhizobium sp. STM 4661]|nr:hypothetical protein MESS4_120032 [Mesorhizobium sp. STM 4661]
MSANGRTLNLGRIPSYCLSMIFSENRFPLFASLTFGSVRMDNLLKAHI